MLWRPPIHGIHTNLEAGFGELWREQAYVHQQLYPVPASVHEHVAAQGMVSDHAPRRRCQPVAVPASDLLQDRDDLLFPEAAPPMDQLS